MSKFASLTALLTNLTKESKSIMVKCNNRQIAFRELNAALYKGLGLNTHNFSQQFLAQIDDASDVGILYSIVERECLAIQWALEFLRH